MNTLGNGCVTCKLNEECPAGIRLKEAGAFDDKGNINEAIMASKTLEIEEEIKASPIYPLLLILSSVYGNEDLSKSQ